MKSGVSYYTVLYARVCFPEDKVCCQYCLAEETYARKQCRLTGEYIADDRTIGYNCKLLTWEEIKEMALKELIEEGKVEIIQTTERERDRVSGGGDFEDGEWVEPTPL